jgi:hypothetical protein
MKKSVGLRLKKCVTSERGRDDSLKIRNENVTKILRKYYFPEAD